MIPSTLPLSPARAMTQRCARRTYFSRAAISFALLFACSAHGATITATSCSQSNVAGAIASASIGDTIQVPAGTCSWSGLSIAKAVQLVNTGRREDQHHTHGHQ